MASPLTRNRLIFLALSVTLAGCSKSPTSVAGGAGATTAEQLAVTTTLATNPAFTTDSLLDQAAPMPIFGAQQVRNGLAAAIRPRFWWRNITHQDRSFTFAFSDSDSTGHPRQADVTVTRHLTGVLNILTVLASDTMRVDSANAVHKPIDDTWVRHLRLRRVLLPGTTHDAWLVSGASGAEAASSGHTVTISSVRVQSTGLDTTVTDPQALWQVQQTFHFAPGDSVMLTATTGHADDIVLCYWHDHRERFHSNGDGTHSFTLRLPLTEGGSRFLAVNALSRGTLFDDTLPYDSLAWVFFCFVGAPPGGAWFH
jgi:hypothetical protein